MSFTTTTLCLGLMGFLLLMEIETVGKNYLLAALSVILVVELLSGLLNHNRLKRMSPGIDGPVFDQGAYHSLFLARMTILLIACVAILLFLLQGISAAEENITWMYLVGGLVVIQEFAGRLLFYASYFRVGL